MTTHKRRVLARHSILRGGVGGSGARVAVTQAAFAIMASLGLAACGGGGNGGGRPARQATRSIPLAAAERGLA